MSLLHPLSPRRARRSVAASTLAVVLLVASVALAQSPPPAPTPPSSAPPAATAAPVPPAPTVPSRAAVAAPPLARANRLALSIAFGFGNASLSSFHEAIDSLNAPTSLKDELKTNLQISVEIGVRYYFPYYVMAHVGYSTLYNSGSAGGVDNHNLVMEIPILVGGYYTFIDRIYVYGALGPSVHFYSRSWFDPGADFKGGSGVGMQFMLGGDFMVGENFSVGLDFRYRALGTGDASELKTGLSPGAVGLKNFDLDFSGVSLGINLRVYAL